MNTSTGPVQVFQTCMRVGASFTDMTAGKVQLLDMTNGRMQLLQTWLMAGSNITFMDADKMKL